MNSTVPRARPQTRYERRLRTTLDSIIDLIATTDTLGRLTFVNAVALQRVDKTAEQVFGAQLQSVFHVTRDDGADAMAGPLRQVIGSGCVYTSVAAKSLRLPDGSRIAVELRISPMLSGSGIEGAVVCIRDISEKRELALEIEHRSTHDALTGLYNRRHLEAELDRLRTCAGSRAHTAVFIDIDDFNLINDAGGHAAGDAALCAVARVIRSSLRPDDHLARFGGDAFVAILVDCDAARAVEVSVRLCNAIECMHFEWAGAVHPISASIGVVELDCSLPSAELVSHASFACHAVKGRNSPRVQLYSDEEPCLRERHDELDRMCAIRAAIERQALMLVAQRIVPLQGQRGRPHYEVLLRLRGADGTLQSPACFIPIAERYGLMPAIDRWVVSAAIGALARCVRHEQLPRLSINVSGTSLGDASFAEFVEATFERHAVPFSDVCFEITETAAVANLALAERFIERLGRLGCEFSLDDFGSGMSSFAYLKRFDVHYLKIDGAFVRNLLADPVDETMVRAIQSVGDVMGFRTVAEFVEDDATRERLRTFGVHFAQGYGVHRPEPLCELLRAFALPAQPEHEDRLLAI